MKVSRYAVSIQYGEGFHHFDSYFPTKEAATAHAVAWKRKAKKGAKPKVHLWYLLDSFAKE